MELRTSGILTQILDNEEVSGIPTTKVVVDQDHLGIRCVRLFVELGDESVGKNITVNGISNPPDHKSGYQEIFLDGDYMKVSYQI